MRASVAVAKVKELLRNSTTFTTAEIASFLNRHIQALTRRLVEQDEGYFNFTFHMLATSARQAHTDVWEYTLPPWLMRITEIRDLSSATTPTGTGLGAPVPFVAKYESLGLRFNGPNTLQLKGYAIAKDFEVRCAKRPALVTKGVLPVQTGMTTSTLRIDADTSTDAAEYPHETLPDSYANAMVEISGQTARSGQLRRCVGSSHFQNEAGTLYTVLTLEPAWDSQPLVTDTYELHVEIPEEHMELVLLLAAHTAWGTRGAYDEQRAMAPLIAEQTQELTRHIRPRQLTAPAYLQHSIMPPHSAGLRNEDTRHTRWV